jgi:hypothetical protein
MAQLTLQQCDNCGYAEFSVGGYYFIKGAEVKFHADGCTMQICENCIESLLARRGMYELTGDAKKPVKQSRSWPPDREQNKHPDSYN